MRRAFAHHAGLFQDVMPLHPYRCRAPVPRMRGPVDREKYSAPLWDVTPLPLQTPLARASRTHIWILWPSQHGNREEWFQKTDTRVGLVRGMWGARHNWRVALMCAMYRKGGKGEPHGRNVGVRGARACKYGPDGRRECKGGMGEKNYK